MEHNPVAFWDLFGADYVVNLRRWQHAANNPAIPATANGGWKHHWTANPDFFLFKGRQLLYYRGNGYTPASPTERHDRIGVAEVQPLAGGGYSFKDLAETGFTIDTGAAGSFDDRDVLDPAAVEFNGQVYLYYSAVGSGPDSVGLAVSADGVHFRKQGKIMDGRAPDVIFRDGRLWMIYQMQTAAGYVGFYLAQSADGLAFTPVSAEPVFQASSKGGWPTKGGWDCQLATARLFEQGDTVYLLYGGHPSLVDQPAYFGLARSTDLLHWERHPGNPIFGCGAKGQEDGGALWFPALLETHDGYTLLYEGSRGDYSWDLSSQICLATI